MKSLSELLAMGDEQLNSIAATLDGYDIEKYMTNPPRPTGACRRKPDGPIELLPNYAGSRDLAFELRKGFTDEQHSRYRTHLAEIINGPDFTMEKLVSSSAQDFVRKMHDASAREQTIAAILVLQNQEKV
jgi:hypothetical protein